MKGGCILVQAMHMSSFGQLQQLVHELWGFFGGALFLSVTLLCRKSICTSFSHCTPVVRMTVSSSEDKKKPPNDAVLGPYRFTHAQLEREGIIVESHVPDNR